MSKLKTIMDSHTDSLASGGGKRGDLPRARVEVLFEPEDCAPGVFSEPFTLTLEELPSGVELECVRSAKGDPIAAGMIQAQRSIAEFNGERVGTVERKWLIEALGARGRNRLSNGYVRLLGYDEESKGDEGDEGKG